MGEFSTWEVHAKIIAPYPRVRYKRNVWSVDFEESGMGWCFYTHILLREGGRILTNIFTDWKCNWPSVCRAHPHKCRSVCQCICLALSSSSPSRKLYPSRHSKEDVGNVSAYGCINKECSKWDTHNSANNSMAVPLQKEMDGASP